MPAAKNKPHVKQEKRVCLHTERERGDKAIEKNRQCERACSIPSPWQQWIPKSTVELASVRVCACVLCVCWWSRGLDVTAERILLRLKKEKEVPEFHWCADELGCHTPSTATHTCRYAAVIHDCIQYKRNEHSRERWQTCESLAQRSRCLGMFHPSNFLPVGATA